MCPALSFSDFKNEVRSGGKRQTIRLLRKKPIQVGDALYLYWKQRTKECELLRKEVCTEAFMIQMQFFEDWLDSGKPIWRVDRTLLDMSSLTLTDWQVEELAKQDGFQNALEMMRWFSKKHGDLNNKKFQIIRW